MTQTYRTTDLTKWGAGKGGPLTWAEGDINFWDIIQRLIFLESSMPSASVGIDHFVVSGSDFYVYMTDASVKGPYILPVATFTDKDVWAPTTVYAPLDTFTINGGLYVVLYPHTSGLTFSAGANDGAGHDYYKLMIQTPGSSLPTGGAAGQVLEKSTSSDFAVTWGWKLPTGGTARQFLIKNSTANQDANWSAAHASDIGFTPPTGSTLTAVNVQDAIDEVQNNIGTHVADASEVTFTPSTSSSLTATHVDAALDELGVDVSAKANVADLLGRETIWVPASSMTPQITNGPAGATIEMTTNKNMLTTLDYDPSTAQYAQFAITMPKSWNKGNIYFQPYWSHASTTTNFGVTWGLEAIAISNGDALDVAFGGGAQFVNDAGGVTNQLYVGDESPAIGVSGSPADGDMIQFRIFRLATGGSDTLAINARLHGIKVVYVTNALTDN